MATDAELYNRMNDSALRNRIEVALLRRGGTEIDAVDSPQKAFSLTLLDKQTAQTIAQKVLRYLVVKYPEKDAPTQADIATAVDGVFIKLAGG